jgi:hypothetical protein
MNVGQLKSLISSLPDNTPIVFEQTDHALRIVTARITVVCRDDHEFKHFGKITGKHNGEVTVLLVE